MRMDSTRSPDSDGRSFAPLGARALVVIPAHNEEANIARVVASVRRHAPGVDVVVIDDGSSDSTACAAADAGAAVVSLPFNMGYGVACQTGFKYARRHGYGYVVQMDGDGQHEPACVPDLLEAVQEPGVDVVLGSRWLGRSNYRGPLLRKFGKRFFGFLACRLTRHDVTDPTTGFQALSKDVVDFYSTDVYPVDYPDADVIIMLDRAGFRVREVPVVMYPDSVGHVSMHAGFIRPIHYGIKMLLSIAMTLLRDDRNLRRMGKALPVGLPLRMATPAARSADLASGAAAQTGLSLEAGAGGNTLFR